MGDDAHRIIDRLKWLIYSKRLPFRWKAWQPANAPYILLSIIDILFKLKLGLNHTIPAYMQCLYLQCLYAMLIFGPSYHTHVYTQVVMVYIDLFSWVSTQIIIPSVVKNSINRTRFLINFPLALRLRWDDGLGWGHMGCFTNHNCRDFKHVEYVVKEWKYCSFVKFWAKMSIS